MTRDQKYRKDPTHGVRNRGLKEQVDAGREVPIFLTRRRFKGDKKKLKRVQINRKWTDNDAETFNEGKVTISDNDEDE